MSFLPYHIVSQSSKDAEMEKDYLVQSGNTQQEEGNEICWITEKNHSFPQSLVVKLEDEMHVGSIEIVTHDVFVPSSMTIAFGVRDTRYHGDKSHHANYQVKSQFSFVENGVFKQKRYIFFNDTALYIRFTVHGFLSGQDNPGRQVGLISIVIKGVASGANYDLPSMLDWSTWKNRQDTGDLFSKRKSPTMPVNTMAQKAPPALYESDTDDEEVIFTKEMLKRLSAKAKELQSNRPASALSDSGVSSTSTVTEKEATVPSTPKAPSTPLSSEPLTPR